MMGRSPAMLNNEKGLKKGPWTPEEDEKLVEYIQKHGHGSWRALPKHAGLKRCGKSCRLRWTNYLRPDIKRGNFSQEEEQMIINLHALVGNKWSMIAGHLPGRTDNEIKNLWNTHLKKKLVKMGIDPITHRPIITTSDHHLLISMLISNLNDHCSMINPRVDQYYNIHSMINAVSHDSSQTIANKMQAAALMHNMILIVQLLQLVRSSTSTNLADPTIINNKIMEAITRNIVLGPSSTSLAYQAQQQLYPDESLTNRSSWNYNMNQCYSRAALELDGLIGNIISPAGLTSFSPQNPTHHNDDEDGDHYSIHTNIPNSEPAAPRPAADYSNKEMSNHEQQQLINGSSSSFAIPNVNDDDDDDDHQLLHVDDWGITTSNINNPIYNSITSSTSTSFDANINWGDLLIE